MRNRWVSALGLRWILRCLFSILPWICIPVDLVCVFQFLGGRSSGPIRTGWLVVYGPSPLWTQGDHIDKVCSWWPQTRRPSFLLPFNNNFPPLMWTLCCDASRPASAHFLVVARVLPQLLLPWQHQPWLWSLFLDGPALVLMILSFGVWFFRNSSNILHSSQILHLCALTCRLVPLFPQIVGQNLDIVLTPCI